MDDRQARSVTWKMDETAEHSKNRCLQITEQIKNEGRAPSARMNAPLGRRAIHTIHQLQIGEIRTWRKAKVMGKPFIGHVMQIRLGGKNWISAPGSGPAGATSG